MRGTPSGRGGDWLLLGWAAVTAVVLLLPPALLPGLQPASESGFDKAGHFAVFLVLAMLAVDPARARTRRPLLAAAVASVLFGAALEGLQAVLGWRTGELADLVANGAGSWAGVLAPSLWRRP